MKIIDAHSHIDYITHQYQPDVVGTICCATDETQWCPLMNLIKQDEHVYGAFGVHPWFVDSVDAGFIARMEKLLKTNLNYMVGEIGLDKYKPDMDKQLEVFIKQFDLAVKLRRVVFLHCVGAWDKILHILKQYKKSELPIIVIHGFNANQKITEQLLQYDNIMFSFGKVNISARNSRIEQIPNNKILVETDGKSGVLLKDCIKQIANIKNKADIGKIIFDNTQKVLNNE